MQRIPFFPASVDPKVSILTYLLNTKTGRCSQYQITIGISPLLPELILNKTQVCLTILLVGTGWEPIGRKVKKPRNSVSIMKTDLPDESSSIENNKLNY